MRIHYVKYLFVIPQTLYQIRRKKLPMLLLGLVYLAEVVAGFQLGYCAYCIDMFFFLHSLRLFKRRLHCQIWALLPFLMQRPAEFKDLYGASAFLFFQDIADDHHVIGDDFLNAESGNRHVFLNTLCCISPCASTVIFCDRSPLAT